MATLQKDAKQSYLENDNLRIEIAVLQEPIKAFIPGFAKFKIPALMSDQSRLNTQTSDDVYIELYVPYEYTFCWGSDVVAEGTRFLVASVGGNLNDMRVIGKYDYNASIPNPAECLAHYIIEIIMLNKREQAILKSCYKNDKFIFCHHHGRPYLNNILDIVPNPYTKSGGLGGLGGIGGGLGDAIGGAVSNAIGNAVGGIGNAIGSAMGSMGSGLGEALGNNLGSAINNSIGGMTQGFTNTINNITNSLNNINNALSGLSNIAGEVNNVVNNIGGTITNITNAAGTITGSMGSNNNMTSNITDMVNGSTGNILNTVANTISGVMNMTSLLSKSVKSISPDYDFFQNPSSSNNESKTKALESFIANTNNYGYLTKEGSRTVTEKITSAINNK